MITHTNWKQKRLIILDQCCKVINDLYLYVLQNTYTFGMWKKVYLFLTTNKLDREDAMLRYVIYKDYKNVELYLKRYGVDAQARENSALEIATKLNDIRMIDLLLEHGADVNSIKLWYVVCYNHLAKKYMWYSFGETFEFESYSSVNIYGPRELLVKSIIEKRMGTTFTFDSEMTETLMVCLTYYYPNNTIIHLLEYCKRYKIIPSYKQFMYKVILFQNYELIWYMHDKLKIYPILPYESREWVSSYINFMDKYKQVREKRAQKKIFWWIIPLLYKPGSTSARNLAQKSWEQTCKDAIE